MRRQGIEAYGGSNNIELGGAAMVEGAQSRYGWRVMGTGRFAQNYQTPNGQEPNSSFWAFNGEGAFGIRGDHGNTTIRASHYGGEFHLLEASGPEPDDPAGGPVRQTLDDRVQLTNDYAIGGLRLETKGAVAAPFARRGVRRLSARARQTTCEKVKDKQAFGLVLNTGTVDVARASRRRRASLGSARRLGDVSAEQHERPDLPRSERDDHVARADSGSSS